MAFCAMLTMEWHLPIVHIVVHQELSDAIVMTTIATKSQVTNNICTLNIHQDFK